jgi:hypothetical protein
MQALVLERIVLPTIFDDALVPLYTPVPIQIYPSLRVVNEHDVLQRWNQFGFEARAGEVGYQVREERDVGSRVFTWEIRFGSDDEMCSI